MDSQVLNDYQVSDHENGNETFIDVKVKIGFGAVPFNKYHRIQHTLINRLI